jgi:hypothetical protein
MGVRATVVLRSGSACSQAYFEAKSSSERQPHAYVLSSGWEREDERVMIHCASQSQMERSESAVRLQAAIAAVAGTRCIRRAEIGRSSCRGTA